MDAYQTLGVTTSASPEEIRKAYKRLAQQLHPDRNKAKNAEAKFKLVQEAYDYILTGVSHAGTFGQPKPPKPAPKPTNPSWAYNPSPSSYVDRVVLNVDFDCLFKQTQVSVGQFVINTPLPVYNGYCGRVMARHAFSPGVTMPYEVTFFFKDPSSFFSLKVFDKKHRLFCQYPVSVAAILMSDTCYVRNINPVLPDLSFKPTLEGGIVKVPHGGLPIGGGKRDDLYIEVIPKFTPLEKESQDTLLGLQHKIREILARKPEL